MNGTNFQIPTGSYYPVFNASDTVTWQHRAHTLNFGFSWWREQNHYYNGVLGFPAVNLSQMSGNFANGDPALGAFSNGAGGTVPNASGTDLSEAQALYSVLAGRIASVSGSYAYNQKLDSYCHASEPITWTNCRRHSGSSYRTPGGSSPRLLSTTACAGTSPGPTTI